MSARWEPAILSNSAGDRIRIAIVMPELLPVPPVKGGAVEHWVHEVTKRYPQNRVLIGVVSRPAGGAGIDGIAYIGVPWTTAEKVFGWIKRHTGHGNLLRTLAKIQNVWSYGRRLTGILRGFDVVCLQNDPNLLLFVDKKPGQRIVLHMHNAHLSSRALRPLYRRLLAKTDAVICVSDYIRKDAVSHFPEYADRFHVLLNATDPEYFKPGDQQRARAETGIADATGGDPVVLYVGRIIPEKGVDVLIKAFLAMREKHPRVKLVIAGASFFAGSGQTPYQTKLMAMAEGAKDSIIFTGYMPHDKIRHLYNASDVVVVSSVWQDPSPLVVYEAMSSGRPLVATRVGGIPEVIHSPELGVLVEPGDPHALAEAIAMLLSDGALRQKLGVAARAAVQARFSWDGLVQRFSSLLEGVE